LLPDCPVDNADTIKWSWHDYSSFGEEQSAFSYLLSAKLEEFRSSCFSVWLIADG